MENEGILLHRRGYAVWITEVHENIMIQKKGMLKDALFMNNMQ